MADSVTAVDTSAIQAQAEALIAQLEDELEQAKTGSSVMLTTTYDTDGNGVVDDAEDAQKLGGNLPAYYATASDVDALEDAVVALQSGAVTGVKGQTESSYRIGNVNITKDNLGLSLVRNNAIKMTLSGTTLSITYSEVQSVAN